MADLLAGMSSEPETPSTALKGTTKQAARGALEAVPFVGEQLAEKAELPQPTTFKERLTRRAARNLPYALAAGPFTGGIPAALGYVGSVGLGQLAEEVGVPEEYQPVAEVAGGGAAQAGREIAGRTLGYIEKPLEELYKKGKDIFELGPGARAAQGMKYGAGETPASAIRNLNKFTEEATKRAGNASKVIDEKWIKSTYDKLSGDVNKIFGNKKFTSTPQFFNDVTSIEREAQTAFGEKGSPIKTILEKNVGGQRPGGSLFDPSFDARGVRGAIEDVNQYLATAEGKQANLLGRLNDALHKLAEDNLQKIDPKLVTDYQNWRKEYQAFASLRDLIQYEGKEGVTAAGQANPSKLLDLITRRTGGNADRNILYDKLAEFGNILKAKPLDKPSLPVAGMRTLSESTLAKALGTMLQPRLPTLAGERAATAQTMAPLSRYTQGMLPQSVEEKRQADEYRRKLFGGQ